MIESSTSVVIMHKNTAEAGTILVDTQYTILRRSLIFMAFINVGKYNNNNIVVCQEYMNREKNNISISAVVIALGWLIIWHYKLIKRGETSIEAHTNRTEAKRMALAGVTFQNPYNFGPKKNLELFFGLVDGRTFWRHFLLPSAHQASGNGLYFEINRTVISNDIP